METVGIFILIITLVIVQIIVAMGCTVSLKTLGHSLSGNLLESAVSFGSAAIVVFWGFSLSDLVGISLLLIFLGVVVLLL